MTETHCHNWRTREIVIEEKGHTGRFELSGTATEPPSKASHKPRFGSRLRPLQPVNSLNRITVIKPATIASTAITTSRPARFSRVTTTRMSASDGAIKNGIEKSKLSGRNSPYTSKTTFPRTTPATVRFDDDDGASGTRRSSIHPGTSTRAGRLAR